MADKAWKAAERKAAALFGTLRHPANSGHRVDFEGPTVIGQVKHVKNLSLKALSDLAEEMAREALPKCKYGVVVAQCRRGRGHPSPMLVIMTAEVWEAMAGKRTEQMS